MNQVNSENQVPYNVPEQEIMNTTQIAAIFREVYNGEKNFFTPVLIRYGTQGAYLYELSRNRNNEEMPLFGVTVLTLTREKTRLNCAWETLDQVEDYIKSLKHRSLEKQ